MICTKCGYDCGDSKFCPKCGTKLVRECKKCGATLNEGDFCPNCGADNSEKSDAKGKDVAAFVSFLVTVVLSGLKIVEFLSIRGSIRYMFNYNFFTIPYAAIAAILSVLAAAVIVFSCLYRKNEKKGFGIVAIVCAGLLKVACPWTPSLLLVLVGTIIHFITVESVKKHGNN